MNVERDKILIVEDESIVALNLEHKLQNSGYDVVGIAYTGEDAVNKTLELNPDLILMDIKLKGSLSGIDAAEIIRTKSSQPVIYLTSYTDDETFMRARETQPLAYIKKPVDPDELQRILSLSLLNYKIKKELTEIKKWYELAVEAGKTGVMEIRLNDRQFQCDPFLKSLFGYKESELSDRLGDWINLIHKDDLGRIRERLIQISAKKESKLNLRFRVIRKDGTVAWIDLSGMYITSDGSSVIIGTLTDITQQKLSEDALKKSEEKFRNIFESAGIGMAILSPDRRFTKVNEPLCSMLGYSQKELMKLFVKDITHPDDLRISNNIITGLLENKFTKPQTFEKRYIAKNGEIVWVLINVSLLKDFNDKPLYFITQVENITSRKSAESQLKQYAEELSSSNAAKDKFFSIISHDLRSPFHTLLGVSDFLTNYTEELSIDEIKTSAESLNRAAHNIYDLLINLLEWSRIQSGNLKVIKSKVNINELVEIVIELFSSVSVKKNITIEKNIPEDMFLMTDNYMVESAVRNLMSNAIKFTPSGGRVNIRAEKKGKYLYIRIADSGVGMDKKDIKKLFRIDQQFSTAGTSNERGTGLGLLLTKEFVEKNRGKIKVESSPGKGSTFTIILPEN